MEHKRFEDGHIYVKRRVPNRSEISGSVSCIFEFGGNLFSTLCGILDVKTVTHVKTILHCDKTRRATLEKCRKHSPAPRVFYISLEFSNARRVLSQCNTRLRLLYLFKNKRWVFEQSERAQGPIYVINIIIKNWIIG